MKGFEFLYSLKGVCFFSLKKLREKRSLLQQKKKLLSYLKPLKGIFAIKMNFQQSQTEDAATLKVLFVSYLFLFIFCLRKMYNFK